MSIATGLTHSTEIRMTVPLCSFDHEFHGYIPERYALKLERNGVAKLVRHKKGSLNRVILHRRPGEPVESTAGIDVPVTLNK